MTTLRVTLVDNQPVVVLPAELAEKLKVSNGGDVQVVLAADGALLRPADPDTAEQLEVAIDVMERRRDALRRLAE